MPLKTCEEVLRLYQEKYFDLSMRHFHEKLREEHNIELSQNTLTGWGRLEGVRKALQEAHVPLREEYVRYSSWSTEDGYQAALQILRLLALPTAVVACNNRLTQGLMRALKNLGLKCPQELSVLGFDEFDWYEFYNPLLTTILQPSYEMGTQATEMLVKVITAQHPPLESDGVNRVVLKAQLRQRESTAPPPTFASVAARESSPVTSSRQNHQVPTWFCR